jgi:hypothetical protein
MKAKEEKVGVEPTRVVLRPRPGEPIYVRELPTPPEVAEVVELYCIPRRSGVKERQEVQEQFNFDFYFSGKIAAYLRTPQGIAVVATDDMPQEEYDAAKAKLTPAERAKLIIFGVPEWNVARIGCLESDG